MQIKRMHLIIFVVVIAIVQLVINNATTFIYLDCMGVLLMVLLLSAGYLWSNVIILSLFSDLIGHWYLGSHLLAFTLLSFIAGYFNNYYKMSTFVQRSVLLIIFYSLMRAILALIEFILHTPGTTSIWGYLVDMIGAPLILFLFSRYVLRLSTDIIFE